MVTESPKNLREASVAPTTQNIQNLLPFLDTCFSPIWCFPYSEIFFQVIKDFGELNKLQIKNTAKMTTEEPVTGWVS